MTAPLTKRVQTLEAELAALKGQFAQGLAAEPVAGVLLEAAPLVEDRVYSWWAVHAKGVLGILAAVGAVLAYLLAQDWIVADDGVSHWLSLAAGLIGLVPGAAVLAVPNQPGPGLAVVDTTTGQQVA